MATVVTLSPDSYNRIMGQLSFFWGPRGRTNILWDDYRDAVLGI